MDYSSWSRCEAVPLSNGIITRRTGLHYLKSPKEICDYYKNNFGTYWFDALPKTDNTYSPTSKYYGCTLAPGIPLIPNLCRRPLRSPGGGSGDYDYSFISSYQAVTQKAETNNHHNSWLEKNNFANHHHDNGQQTVLTSKVNNHLSRLPRRVDFNDSGLDSDSDGEDGVLGAGADTYPHHSHNTVTWFSWILTVVTTITTVITEAVTSWQHPASTQNHVNTRVPLKQDVAVSWYQYPVLWLYKLALLVHRADVWLLYKINSILRVDSYGTPEKRRRWALLLLLIPLLLWAGLVIADYSFPSPETVDRVFNISSWESAAYSPIDSFI